MYAWGSTIHGQLGLGGIEEEHVYTPTELEWSGARTVIKAALGDNHTLFLTDNGKVYSCGSNDYGQLGHDQPRKRPRMSIFKLVTGLEAYPIISIACGAHHSIALNKWGQIFTWGSDCYGQLGHQLGQNLQQIPKILKSLATKHCIQIAAGQYHSIALINNGEIYLWGNNNYGQLGNGKLNINELKPILLLSLYGIPISFITCGSYHTFALSKSGSVFGWGKNNSGQLGLNDNETKLYPTQLRTLRNIRVRYISCGEDFSMFLTLDGRVLTCGSNQYGQLGHNNSNNEILPKQIIELMGTIITQIACGRYHSLVFLPTRNNRLYSFGLGGSGQLGIGKAVNSSVPQVVFISNDDNNNNNNNHHHHHQQQQQQQQDNRIIIIKSIHAGGDHSFVTTTRDNHQICDYRYCCYDEEEQILELKTTIIDECIRFKPNEIIDQELLTYLEIAFKSLMCFNGSFLLDNNQHYYCTSRNHGINLELAEDFFNKLAQIENQTIKELIRNCIIDDTILKLTKSPPDVEALRIYLLLPLYYEFNNCKQYLKLHTPFIINLLQLNQPAKNIIGHWWLNMTNDYFEHLIISFKMVCSFIIQQQKIPPNKTIAYDKSLIAMLDILQFLNQLNRKIDGLKVPYDTFHLNDLNDYIDVRVDYILWLQDPNTTTTNKLFLCNYPFIFDAHAKIQLLETDQSIQMHAAMQNAAQQAFLTMMLSPSTMHTIQQYLILNVTREHIVEDALRELSQINTNDLKKPLRVKFCGEEAEDAGGVRKEFFMLVLREILDPKYGMFKEYEETRAIWFSDATFEDDDVYFLIGLICGLAIYNFTIIDVPFPLALYKKLLNEPIVLSDLKGLSPTITKSLQSLLDYNDDDLFDVFNLYFEITTQHWDETITIELKPNGTNIKVTNDNKQEYVDLYVNYIFNVSVKKQYEAFYNGFMKVCGGRVLKLFHSHELQAVVIGNENYDWHALEEACEYKNGYKSSDQTIRWFWEALHEMPLTDKKKFLLFLTGSDRIPIQGMKAIKIIIQPVNDDKCLPVAHTCFNLLDLPRYQTKEKLKYKLMQAIQHTEGFTLV